MTRPSSVAPRAAMGVILSQFPRYDEAFILRELVELAKGPQELVIFSLRPCRDRVVHEQAKGLLLNTVYARFVWSWAVWRSQARFLVRAPRAYVGALGWVVRRHWRHPVVLLKTLAFFPKTVHFARIAQAQGVSHLHAGWATYPASSALIIERLTGIPYSFSGHAHDLYTTNPTLAEKLRTAQFVLTCTQENKRYLDTLLNGRSHVRTVARSHVVVSHHGVDLARFAPSPKTPSVVCRLLSVGRLDAAKGFETLIEACWLLAKRGLPFHCTVAGGGPWERRLRRLVERHGLAEVVTLTGFVSQGEAASLYQQADLFALPTVSKIHWGIPNVLVEALATKTAVICCELPSLRELVEHEISGWIIPERDPEALARAIESLWANDTLRAQLAEAGYHRVLERFSLEQTGRELRKLFAENYRWKRSRNACGVRMRIPRNVLRAKR